MFKYYEEHCTIEFYGNGVFKLNRRYGNYSIGRYEICEGYLRIYLDVENYWFEEIAYSEKDNCYVLRHLLEQDNGSEMEKPGFEIVGGLGYN